VFKESEGTTIGRNCHYQKRLKVLRHGISPQSRLIIFRLSITFSFNCSELLVSEVFFHGWLLASLFNEKLVQQLSPVGIMQVGLFHQALELLPGVNVIKLFVFSLSLAPL